jgi:hypothetical protein
MTTTKTKVRFIAAIAAIALAATVFFMCKAFQDQDLSRPVGTTAHEPNVPHTIPSPPPVNLTTAGAPAVSDTILEEELLGQESLEEVLQDSEDRIITASIPMRLRIAEDVQVLKAESVEDSVRMLSEVQMFYWPGRPQNAGGVIFPLTQDIGQEDVERIMSNRRFLKVSRELSNLPKERASALVSEQISAALPRYRTMFEEMWKKVVDGRRNVPPGMPATAGPTLQISNNPDHSPTLAGLRLQLLSLVLISGNLELEAARPAVLSVVEEGCRQRERFYKDSEGNEMDRFLMLTTVGLYSRQILATGIQGTFKPQTRPATAEQQAHIDNWEARRLTHYDAAATPYDLLTRGGGPIPPDYTKGSIELRFHKGLDDKAFNDLWKQIGRR